MQERPTDVHGPDPIETNNGSRLDDGPQDIISQNPEDDYSGLAS